MQLTPSSGRWTVVVPLKSTARGKSRLELDPVLRRRVAAAMAQDTVAAARAADGVGTVLVVAEDPADAGNLSRIGGVEMLLTRVSGLNESILDGLRTVRSMGPVAVLPADLPSLLAAELGEALVAAGRHASAVVADRQGTGTTLLASATVDGMRPRYGPGSFARHVAGGAVPLELPTLSGLRSDVDLSADLTGVTGPRTTAVLAGAGWAGDCAAVGLCGARPTG